jgi:hypothetical protein
MRAFSASTASDASSSKSVPLEVTGDGPTMSDGLRRGIGHGEGLRKPLALGTRWCGSGDREPNEPKGLDILLTDMSGERVMCWAKADIGLSVDDRSGASRAMAGVCED